MENNVKRMETELGELDSRLDKLKAFTQTEVFSDLPKYDRILLLRQRDAMSLYSHLLSQRLISATSYEAA